MYPYIYIYIYVYIFMYICIYIYIILEYWKIGFEFSWADNSGSYSELHRYQEELGAKLRLCTSHQVTHVIGGSFTYTHS